MRYRITDDRPLSWSAISAFEYSPEGWYEKYVVHKDCTRDKEELLGWCAVTGSHNRSCPAVETSPQMEFGKKVGERYATDPKFLPKLPRFEIFEHPYKCKFNDISLIGFADGWTPDVLWLGELKTGVKPWDQKRADAHGQITMYNLMANIMEGIRPEKIRTTLMYLPTQLKGDKVSFVPKMKPQFFETRRTMADVLRFGQRINRVYADMQAYVETH